MDKNQPRTREIPFRSSTLETIDYAMYKWLNEEMGLSCDTSSGFNKVEVIWVSAERAFLTKKSQEARDKEGTLNLPLITVERTTVQKNPDSKGTVYAGIPAITDKKRGAITIARTINQDKTQNFENAEAKKRYGKPTFPTKPKKTVYETISIPIPVYIDVFYNIKLRTQYQQQMNELMQPFITRPGGINYFLINNEGHSYECFIQNDFDLNNNISNMQGEERIFETSIDIRTLGYLIGDDKNEMSPVIVRRENAVEIKIPRERIAVGDNPEYTSEKNRFHGTQGVNSGLSGKK